MSSGYVGSGVRRGRVVKCPVCGVRHSVSPKGEELAEHRRKLWLAPAWKVAAWRRLVGSVG